MARPRFNKSKQKGTSFGKKSDAEKSFRKRSRIPFDARRSGGSFGNSAADKRAAFPHKPSGFRRNDQRPEGSDKPRFGKSGSQNSDQGDKRGSFVPGGPRKFSKPFRVAGDPEKKPFRKTDNSFRTQSTGKPYSRNADRTDDRKKPFHNKGRGSFGESDDKPKGYPRPERGAGFSKSFRKSDDFSLPAEGDSIRDGKKSFKKTERKSFVQSRVISSADFTKPGRKQEVQKKEEKGEGLIRLNKYIANSGVGSRREADKLIEMGLISVNGTTITTLGTKVKAGDIVRYEDKVLKAEKPVYILLNKPKGFITTTEDPQERNTVMSLVAGACKERIYPVGRLDRNTTGLLMLTNDGDLADKLTHPSYQAKKVYKVELDKPLSKPDYQKILEGVHLEEGRAKVDDLAIISDDGKTVGLEIHIGWNRVVRRIFESLEYQVIKLDRSVFAGLDKKDLSRGQWRFLKPEEVVRLKHFK
jgi:23S rRNA pseudouridine2605 synthase